MTDNRDTPDHEAIAQDEVLVDVLTGARTLDDPEVRRRLADSPWLAAPLRELLEDLERFEGARHVVRDEWEAAAAATTADDRASAAAFVGSALAGPRPLRSWLRTALAVAAVVALASFASWWFVSERTVTPGHRTPGQPERLGDEVQGVRPSGADRQRDRFTWPAAGVRSGWFEVRVFATDAAAGAAPLLTSGELRVAEWRLDAAAQARVAAMAGFRWEVLWSDEDGQSRVVARATVDP